MIGPLEYVDQQWFLGVQITSDLRCQAHTEEVRGKAAKNLGFVQRNLRGCKQKVKKTAYLSLVKPIMTYGLPAWHPSTKENTNKLERVQKRALHFIHGRHLPPSCKTDIMPIDMHLKYTDLLFFKRCSSGAIDFDARARIIQGRTLRGDNAQHPRLQPPPVRTAFGQKAFSFRVVKPWNDLPPALKECDDKNFPSECKLYLWQQ
jgi:hypothetical protein